MNSPADPPAPTVRRINQAGMNLIRQREGLRTSGYLDDRGIPTIGVGHTGTCIAIGIASKPYIGMVITVAQAMILLLADLEDAETIVSKFVTIALNDNQFAALVSLTFNIGGGAFEASTLLKVLNGGYYDLVPNQIMRWDMERNGGVAVVSTGLKLRRQGEVALWNTPVDLASP